MARKKKGLPVNGWVLLDKPLGITSTQAVGRVRRLFNARKAGHGGTLDPLASGVLPIALGEATKTVAYVMQGVKRYRFSVKWGEATSTDDAEGEVIETSPQRPDEAEIEAVLGRFHGDIEQVPPLFSAIRVEGRRAYDMARAKESFELQSRRVEILALDLVDRHDAERATFEVTCGKGAYMRSLARDLGQALGTCAHVIALRRLSVGPFDENRAISLESLEALGHSPAALEHLLPVEASLDGIPAMALSEAEANRLRCGQAVSLLARINRDRIEGLKSGEIVYTTAGGKLIALARYEAGEIVPVRVLNL
ncbi:MAG TPA: tRNA pseudouridine(55) synthase TruB [Kiloniellaceae bacterium]|nr:tRNA pseudouridine(55) synthase TruB [Kiloniellaceae bacterium]